ncbi:MAG: RlmE family RNA methyltransferase [Rickettsiales bacterium]|nr:RlmE family RNA methyltransferase [Rickettsiales bacterium]
MPLKTQKLKKSRKLKESSKRWILRQLNDPYVEKARMEGWRSRAAYKIIEIDEKFKIFKKGKFVIDLGAAPGGWSQVAANKVGEGNVLGIDLLEIDSIPGVELMQQDFLAENAHEIIIAKMKEMSGQENKFADVIMTDMAANTTGDKRTDHTRIIDLLEESLCLSEKILNKGGYFVGKIFQGGSSDEIVKSLRKNFKTVKYFKPKSSRKDSAETYLVALDFKS